MTAAALAKAPTPILRSAAGEPPLGAGGEAFRADQGEMLFYDNERSPATRIGVLELEDGTWLAFPFGVDRERYETRAAALRAGIAAMVRKARRYMRNAEGEGTHWSEGFAGRVIEWALSLKPLKMPIQVASQTDAAPIDHPGTMEEQECATPADSIAAPMTGSLAVAATVAQIQPAGTMSPTKITTRTNISDLNLIAPAESSAASSATAPDKARVIDDKASARSGGLNSSIPADPIVRALIESHRARKTYPAGHTFAMTNPVINGHMVTLGSCSCGETFSYAYGSAGHEMMDAAIEAHWQKFDAIAEKIDGRGFPIGAETKPLSELDDDDYMRRQHQALADVNEGRDIDGEMFKNLRGLKHVSGKSQTPLKLTKSGKDRLAELHEYFDRLMKLNMLPTALDDLIALYRHHLMRLNDFVLASDEDAAILETETLRLLQERANNNSTFGVACDDSPAERLRVETAAPVGEAPGWWQRGVFRLVIDDVPHIVVHDEDANVSVYAEDPDKSFVSETGFQSLLRGYIDDFWLGHTVAQQVERGLRETMAHANDGSGKLKLRTKPLPKPSSWYRLPTEGEGFEPVNVGDADLAEAAPPKPKQPRKRKPVSAPEGTPAPEPASSDLALGGAGVVIEAAPIGAGSIAQQMAASPGDDWSPLLSAALDLAWREPPQVTAQLKALLDFSKVYGGGGEVERPVLRWHGGKWRIAPWVMSFFPEHRIYVEPFGGAGSILLRKRRVYAEVYNDLDDVVTNLFRVLRDEAKAAKLIEALRLTPFSRAEFKEALLEAEDDVERARHLIVRSFMGFGSNAHSGSSTAEKTGFKSFTRPDEYRSTGFRANSSRSGTTPAHDWANYPDAMPAIIDRLRGVIVEQRPAIEVMRQHDGEMTLHYVDPPYLPETRSPANKYDLKHRMYRHELTVDDHRELLAFLHTLRGFVVLSGYPSQLYEDALPDWRRVTCATHADGARERTEVLWLNPACVAALDQQHPALFDIAALDAANTPPLGHDGS